MHVLSEVVTCTAQSDRRGPPGRHGHSIIFIRELTNSRATQWRTESSCESVHATPAARQRAHPHARQLEEKRAVDINPDAKSDASVFVLTILKPGAACCRRGAHANAGAPPRHAQAGSTTACCRRSTRRWTLCASPLVRARGRRAEGARQVERAAVHGNGCALVTTGLLACSARARSIPTG